MSKIKDFFKLTNVEVLFVIVMLAISIMGGIAIFSVSTGNRHLLNFKDDTGNIVKAAKASYIFFEKLNNEGYIVSSSDGTTKGMCITIQGLKANDFLTQEYKNWDGYVVIESSGTDKYNYGIWITNQKYVINGYDAGQLSELELNKGITEYNNETFSTKVRQSFTGTSGKNGGTGNTDGSRLKQYETKCINEKIE